MVRRFSKEDLYQLRNTLEIRRVIEEIICLPSKIVEGIYRFLCPRCNEFQTAVHPRENLGRCFRCQRNFNTIELVMETRQLDFVSSVKLLQGYKQVPKAGPVVRNRANESASLLEPISAIVARSLPQTGGLPKKRSAYLPHNR